MNSQLFIFFVVYFNAQAMSLKSQKKILGYSTLLPWRLLQPQMLLLLFHKIFWFRLKIELLYDYCGILSASVDPNKGLPFPTAFKKCQQRQPSLSGFVE